jgi:uncharacterized protein YbaR (Trm112 family)
MALQPFLLEILVCPETKANLQLAPSELVRQINAAIEKGSLMNKAGDRVQPKIEAALVRQDNSVAYPVRDDIPVLLVDEQIDLSQLR